MKLIAAISSIRIGHGKIDEIDSRYQQYEDRNGEERYCNRTVALGGAVGRHIMDVVGIVQAGKTDYDVIASCRKVFHVVLQHRQGLLRHGRPDITAVCPRAAIG